jgi:hypothetical protein
LGISPVLVSTEVVKHRVDPARIQLEHGSGTESATNVRGAIKIPRRVHGQTSVGVRAVGWLTEGVKHGLMAARIHLEYRPVLENSAQWRSAVQVACRVHDQVCKWPRPVRPARKAVEHRFRVSLPLRRWRRENREHKHDRCCEQASP